MIKDYCHLWPLTDVYISLVIGSNPFRKQENLSILLLFDLKIHIKLLRVRGLSYQTSQHEKSAQGLTQTG